MKDRIVRVIESIAKIVRSLENCGIILFPLVNVPVDDRSIAEVTRSSLRPVMK